MSPGAHTALLSPFPQVEPRVYPGFPVHYLIHNLRNYFIYVT